MSLNSVINQRLRKSFIQAQLNKQTRGYFQFNYPHSFRGVNNAFNNVPQKNQYPHIKRTFQPGEVAPLAHQNQRVFPDWYKPYMANYTSDGYLIGGLLVFGIFGYSYMNDIKEAKGRKQRKVFPRTDFTYNKLKNQLYGKERIEAGDPEFTKFLQLKERSHGHH